MAEIERVRFEIGALRQGLEQFRGTVIAGRDIWRRIDAKAAGRPVECGEIGVPEIPAA